LDFPKNKKTITLASSLQMRFYDMKQQGMRAWIWNWANYSKVES